MATFNSNNVTLDEDAFDTFHRSFVSQIPRQFQTTRVTEAERVESLGMGLRSSQRSPVVIDYDDDDRLADVTKLASNSRYHWEDLLSVTDGDRILIYFRNKKKKMRDIFKDNAIYDAGVRLRSSSVGGDLLSIAGQSFFVMQAEVIQSEFNRKAISGDLTKKEFQIAYEGNQGITVAFVGTSTRDGTRMKIPFPWRTVYALRDDVYFFGPQTNSARRYSNLFYTDRRNSPKLVKRIFWDIAKETFRDHFKSSCLLMAFQSKMIELERKNTEKVRKEKIWLLDFNERFSNGNKQYSSEMFFKVFDQCCKLAFFKAILTLQCHNQSIIDLPTFDVFLEKAPQCFPQLWDHMSNLRNVKGQQSKQDNKHILNRKRQTLLQIFSLRRMRNPRKLVWWALIQAVAFYGWGVGRTALDAIHFWGLSCSARSRERLVGKLTENLTERRTQYLSKRASIAFTIDNYEERCILRFDRGGHGSAQFSGTHEIACGINEYVDKTFNGLFVEVSYTTDQDYISPVLMPAFEQSRPVSAAHFFMGGPSAPVIPPSNEPDTTGDRVRHCCTSVIQSRMVGEFHRVFGHFDLSRKEINDLQHQSNNVFHLYQFVETCSMDGPQMLFNKCGKWQDEIVRIWDILGKNPAEINYMGVQPVSEASAHGCGGLALDLCRKFGLIVQDSEGKWVKSDEFERKRALIFGDVKTCDNIDLILNRVRDREPNTVVSEEGAAVIEAALEKLVVIPGDWHAGLCMLQSIFDIYWEGFLQPFSRVNKTSRVSKDVSQNYYTSSKLVLYVRESLIANMMHGFVSSALVVLRAEFNAGEQDLSDENFVCFVASAFQTYLSCLHESDDTWLRMCAMFLHLTDDFFRFVASYRCGDSIGIEVGYQNFLPVWRSLGHTRYLERHWRQLEVLFGGLIFHELEELRRNRTERRYLYGTGKGELAKDESLELANRFLAQFPRARTFQGFADQALNVGIAIKCKRLVTALFKFNSKDSETSEVYRSSYSPKCANERRRIYEVFMLLSTSTHHPGRTFSKNYITGAIPLLTTPLADPKIEGKINDSTTDDCYGFLSSVGQVVEELDVVNDEGDLDNVDLDDEVDAAKVARTAALAEITKLTRAPKTPKRKKKEVATTPVPAQAHVTPVVPVPAASAAARGVPIAAPVAVLPPVPELPPVHFLGTAVTEEDERIGRDRMDDDANRTYVAPLETADPLKKDVDISEDLGYNCFMLHNIWSIGKERLDKDNVKGQRAALGRRVNRKRQLARALSNVDSGPDGAPAVSEMKDEVSVPEQLWDTSSHTHYPEFYQ